MNTDKFLKDKKCIIRILNNDDLCRARAIVTEKAKIDQHEKWESVRKGGKIQEILANQLHERGGVHHEKCGIDEIKKFQDVLSDYQIFVVSKDRFYGIIYSGPEAQKKIYLYFHDNHYDVITSMPAFLSRNYYCTKCNTGYDHKEDHNCKNICHACRKVHEPSFENWIECDKCHRFFRGQQCFDLHKRATLNGNSICKSVYRCNECGKTVNRKLDKNHVCGRIYCHTCRDFFNKDHQCYIMPEESSFQQPLSIEEELVNRERKNIYNFFLF